MGSNVPLTVRGYAPVTHSRRVLLCNPPIYDTRFPWARFQQPISLLQLSTLLKHIECDVHLLDALPPQPNAPLRRRMRVFTRDDISLNWWRFGRLPSELEAQLIAFKREEWQPDEVYIEGFTTFWWEGVAETIALVRKHFPHTRVILFGAYPTLAPNHAIQQSGADVLIVGQIEGLAGLPLDLSLYSSLPAFTYLSIGTVLRSAQDLVEEFFLRKWFAASVPQKDKGTSRLKETPRASEDRCWWLDSSGFRTPPPASETSSHRSPKLLVCGALGESGAPCPSCRSSPLLNHGKAACQTRRDK
jgi:hypothetical protein